MNKDSALRPASGLRLLLVRHAEHVDFGRRLTGRSAGVPLSDTGAAQAAALGARLAPEPLDEIQTSPRERARDTAAAIATRTGVPVRVVAALDEIDFGAWTGAAFADLEGRPDWDAWNAARSAARAPGGESMAEAAGRIVGHVSALAAGGASRLVALVSHCDMIRALVAFCLGLSLDNLLRFEIAPASVSRIETGPWGARVLSLNETAA